MSGSSPTFVSQVRIRRKIVIVDKTQNEVIASILIFTHLRVLPATIRKLHNQAIRQAVPAKKNMKKKVALDWPHIFTLFLVQN